ncbi:MAG: hypothetical protein ACRC7C_03880, partial [Beijerinckiaceae bacterium]
GLDRGDLLSLLLSRLVQLATPAIQTPYAALVASLTYGVFAMALVGGMQRVGRSFAEAVGLTLLLLAHPLMATALLEGPSAILFSIALFSLGLSIFVLHRDGSPTALMATGLSLAFVASVGHAGLEYALAALPLIAFVCPRALLQVSAFRLGVTIVFPLVCVAFGLVFIDWVFKFNVALRDIDAPSMPSGAPVTLPAETAIAMSLSLVSIMILAFLRWRPRLVLLTPMFALVGHVFLGGLLMLLLAKPGQTSAPILASVVTASAVILVRWPEESFSRPMVFAVLILQVILGWLVFGLPRPAAEATDDMALGRFIAGRSQVLFDAANAPSVVAARGYVSGLVLPDREPSRAPPSLPRDYALVVTHDPQTRRGAADRVNQRMPDLFAGGAPGMRLVHAQGSWRVYGRDSQWIVSGGERP